MTTISPKAVRVRMAPSPTGPLHIGTARTSLYNFLFARHVGGTFVLRIEDTDVARGSEVFERDIIEGLHWLGLSWDEGPQVAGGEDVGAFGPYRQSQRMDRYAAEAERLLAGGVAYRCYCTPDELAAERGEQEARREPPRYSGRCRTLSVEERQAFEAEGRTFAIRFAVPPEKVAFDDIVRGTVEFDNALLGDFVIVRTDGMPLYNFVAVVDDAAMAISHVLRGEEHLSNTPKQIALYRALGYEIPRFGHVPLILNPDRSKMSKRKSQTALSAYREQGYLPEALVNFLAFLGWSPGTEEEIFSLDELASRFEIEKVHKAGAIFDADRLDYLNGTYIRSLGDEQLALRLRPFVPALLDDASIIRLVPLVRERLVRLGDVVDLASFLWEPDATVASWYGAALLTPKGGGPADALRALERARQIVTELDAADFSADVLDDRFRAAATELGMKPGDFFKPIRVALTGRTISPPLFASMELLGHDRCLARIDEALGKVQ
jgi:nondiscriminating glutamyl-tRNA synthetase